MSFTHLLEIANTQKNVSVLSEALTTELARYDIVPTCEVVGDTTLKIQIDGSSSEEVATLVGQYVLRSDYSNIRVLESACESCALLLLDGADENIAALEQAGLIEVAKPLDPEDDDDDDDDESFAAEVDGEIDPDDDTEDLEEDDAVSDVDEGSMKILSGDEGFRLATRLHTLSCGNDKKDFPKFLMEMDKFMQSYRERSGFNPNAQGQETASFEDFFVETAAFLEEARRKKGKKGEFKEGRSGFLSAYMRIVSKNSDALTKAWDALDIEEMVRILSEVGGILVDRISDERIKRGLDVPEEENTNDEMPGAETAGATYYVLYQFNVADKVWEPQFSDKDKETVKSEYDDYRDHDIPRKHLRIESIPNGLYQKNVDERTKKLNMETAEFKGQRIVRD